MLELQQDGNAVTGTITCQDGQVSVNGSISGNQISLEGSERVSDSQIFDYSFTGSLNDMFSAMSGNAVVTDLSGINTPLEGTWSATRSN